MRPSRRARSGRGGGGKWTRQVTGRGDRSSTPYGAIFLVVLAVLIIAGALVAGFALDRQLTDGLMAQRAQARQRADWVPLRSLPGYVPAALITAADPEFLERETPGEAIQGGSLARSIVRQLHGTRSGLTATGRELILTPLLAHRLGRAGLLELYLNRVYLGESGGTPIFGVSHAAREFFGKEPTALTPGEAATLGGLLLPPALRVPGDDPGAAGVRRNEMLRRLAAAGLIDASQWQAALEEPLAFQPGLRYEPMTRKRGWSEEPWFIRVPWNPQAGEGG